MSNPGEHLYTQFKAVFHTYYNSLCSYAFTFIKNTDQCEDIVQEVFTRVWEDRKDLVIADSIRFYLFVAVRNNCISCLRKTQRYATVEWKDDDTWYGQEPADDGEAFSADRTPLLEEAIGRLPPKCREVFTLTRISGMSYKQVAGVLGISAKTVENQVGKALKMLRGFLKEKGFQVFLLLIKFISAVGVMLILTLYRR